MFGWPASFLALRERDGVPSIRIMSWYHGKHDCTYFTPLTCTSSMFCFIPLRNLASNHFPNEGADYSMTQSTNSVSYIFFPQLYCTKARRYKVFVVFRSPSRRCLSHAYQRPYFSVMIQGQVGENYPAVQNQGLRKGRMIGVWLTDSGSKHKDIGKPKQKGCGCRVNSWQYTGAGPRPKAWCCSKCLCGHGLVKTNIHLAHIHVLAFMQ